MSILHCVINFKLTKLSKFSNLLALATVVTGFLSTSAFASLIGIPIGISFSTVLEIQICAITAEIKGYKSIIKEKEKEHNKIVLFAKLKME